MLQFFVLNAKKLIGLKQTLALGSLIFQIELKLFDACFKDYLVCLFTLEALLHFKDDFVALVNLISQILDLLS